MHVIILLLSLLPMPAASLHKCLGTDGVASYQSLPCAPGQRTAWTRAAPPPAAPVAVPAAPRAAPPPARPQGAPVRRSATISTPNASASWPLSSPRCPKPGQR